MERLDHPPERAFAAFGVDPSSAKRLDGGRGLTWRARPVILRPSDSAEEASFRSEALEHIEHSAKFRAPRPIRTASGAWTAEGWEAWQWVPGEVDESRVSEVLAAGAAFHVAIAHLDRTSFIDTKDGPWARADRIVWEEESSPADPTLDALTERLRPVSFPSQVIHGDLLGNVLFHPGQPPTIIDWAPYWRPPGFAAATAVVDAGCWHGITQDLIPALGADIDEWNQLVLRALIFRTMTLLLIGAWDQEMVARHQPVLNPVLALNE